MQSCVHLPVKADPLAICCKEICKQLHGFSKGEEFCTIGMQFPYRKKNHNYFSLFFWY